MFVRERLRWVATLVALGLCTLLNAQGCVVGGITDNPTSCKTSADCPGSQLCINQKCTLLQPQSDASIEATTESVPENPTEAAPEAAPEVAPEATPEAPDSGCETGQTQPCDGGCGKGTQTCAAGKWGPCRPADLTRSCYEGPAGTEAKGECKAGTQTCTVDDKAGTATWGACENQTQPVKEVCDDGKDNDCNGEIDEKAAGCSCKSGAQQACGVTKGACKAGTQTCTTANAWGPCEGEVKPTQETCNDIDDDCDGQIDEDFPRKGQSCQAGIGACQQQGKFVCSTDQTGLLCDAKAGAPATELCNGIDDNCNGQIDEGLTRACYDKPAGCKQVGTTFQCTGECKAGTQTCDKGQWGLCKGEVNPTLDLCRDGKDNDCDGTIDDICGQSLIWLVADSSGTIKAKHNNTSITTALSRKAKGAYYLQFGLPYTCGSYPLFVTVNSPNRRSASYACNTTGFDIFIGDGSVTSRDTSNESFSVVVPTRAAGEVWGVVNHAKCLSLSPYTCPQNAFYGGSSVKRISTGIYEIDHTSCNGPERPMFVTPLNGGLGGYAMIAYYKPGICRVSTHDFKGKPEDQSFSYWLPNPSAHAWATISVSNQTKNNNFSDAFAKWNQTREATGKWLDVTYDGFANPSAALVSPHTPGKLFATGIEYPAALTNGVRIHAFTVDTNTQSGPVNLSVMFVQ